MFSEENPIQPLKSAGPLFKSGSGDHPLPASQKFDNNADHYDPNARHYPEPPESRFRAEFSGEWPYEPVQLMRDLVEGRLTLETVHLQRVGLDWFESEDYNVFINKETGEVIYALCSKRGNLLGARAYRAFLVINGLLAPFLVGVAVATFFTGSEFVVNRDNMTTLMPVISRWTGPLHGLEALGNVWNWVLGIAVALLVQMLGAMYVINNVDDARLDAHCRRVVRVLAVPFVAFFVSFVVVLLTTDGYAADPATGEVTMQPGKYLANFVEMPAVAAIFLAGVVLVLLGVWVTVMRRGNRRGIWLSGTGTVLAVMALLLCAGYNGTAYYPSSADLQSSLTIANSSSSLFTLRTMAFVSILIPFVLAYIVYAWRAIDRRRITPRELDGDGHAY